MDTIIVVVMLLCPVSVQDKCNKQEQKQNRFSALFEQADKEFSRTHRIDIEQIRKASREAVISADIKTREEREKVLK